jgi:hypothetical protein
MKYLIKLILCICGWFIIRFALVSLGVDMTDYSFFSTGNLLLIAGTSVIGMSFSF